MKLDATKVVYCYYFPEVREIIDKIVEKYPHDIFLKSIKPGLDNFHVPIVEKFVKFHSKNMPKLADFSYRYVTNGASEGIFKILVQLKSENADTRIYVLQGEYEGFKAYAENIGLKVFVVDKNEDPTRLKKGVWFISNPSARNGNIIPNEFINNICNAGHRVVFDATYVGLTKAYKFDVSHKNIIAVIYSMSKPFGLYYYRIGFTFTRFESPTLEANKWFKSIFSLIIADKILSELEPDYLYRRYRPIQNKIIKNINQKYKLNLKPSDAILLANTKDVLSNEMLKFKRGKFYRFCLTPYFLKTEVKNENK